MSEQPEALRLADALTDYLQCSDLDIDNAADELRRLHTLNTELLEALSDIAYGLEGARIWGGMEWTYNPLHPFKYLPLRDKARAAIARAEGTYKATGGSDV